eukprot:SAG31_NODE_23590_length_501_cov_0.696517_1_plen_118_part_00
MAEHVSHSPWWKACSGGGDADDAPPPVARPGDDPDPDELPLPGPEPSGGVHAISHESSSQGQEPPRHGESAPSIGDQILNGLSDVGSGAAEVGTQVRGYFLVFVPTIREIRDFSREM